MRERVLRAAWNGVLVVLGLVALPCLVFIPTWKRRIGFVVLCGIAAVVARIVVVRSSRRIAVVLTDLADRAERTAGEAGSFQPVESGIDEIDRISHIFERRSAEMARTLAAEREFASDASHQLRTPLTALLIRLEEISMVSKADEARVEAEVAIEQVERLTGVVDQLLSRSRTEGALETRPVSLDSVIARLQREFQPAFERARRSVRVGGERGLWVRASQAGLQQILGALLENALSHGGGTVDLSARRSGPSVVLEVSDLGPGVDPAIAAHIFERSVSTGGTGIGLGLARDLAEAFGGRLELRSLHPAVFVLFVSTAEPDPAEVQPRLATERT